MRRMTAGMLRRKVAQDLEYYSNCFTGAQTPQAVQEISIQLTKLSGRDLDEESRKKVNSLIRICTKKMKQRKRLN